MKTPKKYLFIVVIILALLINFLLFLPFFLTLNLKNKTSFVVLDLEKENKPLEKPEEELIEYLLSSGAYQPNSKQEMQSDAPAVEHAHLEQIQNAPSKTPTESTESIPSPPIEKSADKEIDVREKDVATTETDEEDQPEETLPAATSLIKDLSKSKTLPQKKPSKRHYKKIAPEAYKRQVPVCARPPEIGLSLGKITQGLLKSMQQEEGLNVAPHTTDMNRIITHQYATKVWNLIKNCFKCYENKLHLARALDTPAYLVITLKQSGELVDIHLEANEQSHALKQIENLIVKHAKQAGLFPPLPTIFNAPEKKFTFPLHIKGAEGCHSYRMGYEPQF